MTVPWLTTRIVLETGGPWEVMPSDMPHYTKHAEAYCASRKTDPAARTRVREVWLEGKNRPAWRPFTPVQGLAKRVTTPDSGAVIDADTGEIVDDEAPF